MKPARAAIELKASICTDNPTGTDIYPFGAGKEAQHVANNGIERQGGLLPLYEQETTFATAGQNSIITAGGDTLQVDSSDNVLLNNVNIGNVGPLSVYRRGSLAGYVDAAWSADDTILAITRNGTAITLYELNPATMTATNSRTITFAGMATSFIVTVSIVRYVDMHYADNQEFIVRYYQTTADKILKESGLTITSVSIAGAGASNHTGFAHRFGANKYVYGDQGNPQGFATAWYAGDILVGGGGTNAMTNAKWCVIQRCRGTSDSMAILTFDAYKDAGNTLTCCGIVGYDGLGAYTGTITDQVGLALGAATATVQNLITGPGYAEATYTRSDTGTNIYSIVSPNPVGSSANLGNIVQTQTQTPYNGYGKLNDCRYTWSWLMSWRVVMVNGVPSFLSGAGVAVASNPEILGVPLTNNGEFDPYYVPHIVDTASYSRIIYRYAGVLYFIDVRSGAGHTIDRISDTVYQINCISPISIVDTTTKTLELGVNDYNGRIRWSSSAAITSTSKAIAVLSGRYSNSLDPGDKLITMTTPPGSSYISGIEKPAFWSGQQVYTAKLYLNDAYSISFITWNTSLIETAQANTLYITDTRQPIAMGYSYGDRTVIAGNETIFTGVGILGATLVNYGYAGYEIGNVANGSLVNFVLFEQRYVFDGYEIFSATFFGPLLTGMDRVCRARGMTFIAASPTEAYFLSSFDTSLYVFNGGRSLEKMKRLNDIRNASNVIEQITDGIYSSIDNTILLQTANTFVWIRDGVVTQTYKKASQTGITLYDTTAGIQIANNTQKWRYTFFALTGPASTVVPFTFQSAYFGVTQNLLGVVQAFIFAVQNATPASASFTVTIDGFDADGEWHEDIPFNLIPSDWSPLGLYRARVIPQHTMQIAVSVGFKTSSRLLLHSIVPEFTPDASSTPAASRSK